MIVKIAKRTKSRSSFAKLADYIAKQAILEDGTEKVLYEKYTNCHALDNADALLEITATQELNRTTKADKTYHIIVSFPLGERPEEEVLDDIEEELIKAIGFQEHQRLRAIHRDTAHLHMHIAVNKIHPETLRNYSPGHDFKSLQTISRVLEVRHGLELLVKDDRKKVIEDTEILRENITNTIAAVVHTKDSSWAKLHASLKEYDVKFIRKGRGLLITDGADQLSIKPSDLSRDFSRAQLENALGPYAEPGNIQQTSKTAQTIEAIAKIQSFQSWAQENMHKPIQQAVISNNATWDTLHQALAEQGLQIKPRGRGLVITDRAGKLKVKPSQIDRQFSMKNLVEILGEYQPNVLIQRLPPCPYERAPQEIKTETEAQEQQGDDELKVKRLRGGEPVIEIPLKMRGTFDVWAAQRLQQPMYVACTNPAADWQLIHDVLREHGLQIIPKGRGLIITDQYEKHAIKPSQIDRKFSRDGLEKIFGQYQSSKKEEPLPPCLYEQHAMPKDVSPQKKKPNRSLLWEQWHEQTTKNKKERRARFALYVKERNKESKDLSGAFTALRAEVRDNKKMLPKDKQKAYSVISQQRMIANNAMRAKHAATRKRIQRETAILMWPAYLILKAQENDPDALSALKSRLSKGIANEQIQPIERNSTPRNQTTNQRIYNLSADVRALQAEVWNNPKMRNADKYRTTKHMAAQLNVSIQRIKDAEITQQDNKIAAAQGVNLSANTIKEYPQARVLPNGDIAVGTHSIIRDNIVHNIVPRLRHKSVEIAVKCGGRVELSGILSNQPRHNAPNPNE